MKSMQKFLIAFVLIILGNTSFIAIEAQEAEKNVNQYARFSEQSTWVLGYFNRSQITRPPHSEWFTKIYDDYQINTESVNRLLDISQEGISIKIVMGTWCPDSRKQIGRAHV